jgi:DNA polymerase III delta prime subunit
MCRYAFYNYKNTYGCFNCQVGFKRRNLYDVQPELSDKLSKEARVAKEKGLEYVHEGNEAKCPNCGGEMANLGRDLRLPAKHKDEEWRCIKYLVDNKYNIYSCGCQGIGFVPHKIQDAITLVAERAEIQKMYQKNQAIKDKFAEKVKEKKKRANERKTKILLKEVAKEEKEYKKMGK